MFKRLVKISDKHLSPYERLKANLLNKISLYCIYFALLFDASYLFTQRYAQLLIVTGSIVGIFLPTILFQKKGWYLFGRIYFTFSLFTCITLTSIYNINTGDYVLTENMLIVLAPMLVILFESRLKAILYSLTILLFFWIRALTYEAQGQELINQFISSSMIYIVVLLGIYYFVNSHKEALKKIYLNQSLLIDQLAYQKKELERVNQTKNKLFSIVAHDLRKPVHMLGSLIQLDEDHLLSEEERSHFRKKVNENIIGINTLIENLLAWAKSQMEGFKINKQSFELNELIRQEEMVYREQARIKGLDLKITLHDKEIKLHSDPDHLSLVTRNIISNCIKFTPRNGEIHLRAKTENAAAHITITDTGVGMDNATISAIKSNDYLESKKGTEGEPGSGLGLSLCVETLEKIGGELDIQSKPEKGSEFRIKIPIK